MPVKDKKIPWPERAEVIKGKFPSTSLLDWHSVFSQDPAILGKIINDIIKLDQVRTGKPGKRPSLNEKDANEKFRKFQNDDYTELEFSEALRRLSGKMSVRNLATQTGLDKSYVHRLLHDDAVPSPDIITQIAKSFGKHPSYFIEYRVGYVLGMISNKLMQSPEASIVFYNKLAGRNERA